MLADRLVAADGRAALIVLRLSLGFASERASAVVAQTEEIVAAEIASAAADLRAAFSGEATLGRDYLAAIEEGGRRSGSPRSRSSRSRCSRSTARRSPRSSRW